MIITEFDRESVALRSQLADLLALTWPEDYAQDTTAKIAELLSEERIAVAALEEDQLIGFVGAIPQYGVTGWEMHPLVVTSIQRGNRIGARLVKYLEKEVASAGGLTIYLGTDDEKAQTTLSEGDLFENPFEQVKWIKNKDNHPFEFYEKQGYQIVGVLPDVNGWNKPDILMAKTVGKKVTEHAS
ncbi:AAC(6')-Ii family aminoglycoside 6'-N-acetyltransferase [Enterococcus sp. JM4C]|uniref:aminoglycoside N-acetyltransferase AAC(6')-Ii n=1 Tax=Candidatus Enterococcus huntleyi TaxID=1857217 RepID=UPI00137A3428|nr:aminoglycoside N-acetyltransferase AAC(6')-Ii [Enterococcus sp. JM4C]KAF1296443.1 AAC(6')-Ii family aminoglycoside 6'-N-acetyltransferase [Enterococcus sp. JM4C]